MGNSTTVFTTQLQAVIAQYFLINSNDVMKEQLIPLLTAMAEQGELLFPYLTS